MRENPTMSTRRSAPLKKAPKKPAPPRRPRKNGHGPKEVSDGLPPDLLAELDSYVVWLSEVAPGASRGDVLSAALRRFLPFRLWGLTRRVKNPP